MSNFAWISAIASLSEPALTVLAQTINASDVPDNLIYERFFPRENVDSVDLDEITTLDYRPVADRREWNQRGRLIPNKTPDTKKVSIVPVESYFKWGEYELQKLKERTLGNAAVLQQIMETSIPGKLNQLVESNYRRIELDAFSAWILGTITQKNPQTGETFAASLNYDAGRYLTAPTAWNDAGVNA
ncbi:MAG: major capsid protein, partial [Pyrinomonadaceae bacterium]|nr:major capsid protein [Pyrinomonadaceae bacterium]